MPIESNCDAKGIGLPSATWIDNATKPSAAQAVASSRKNDMLHSPDLGQSLSNLVKDISALGISVPTELKNEIALARKVRDDDRTVAHAIQAKQSELRSAPTADYDTIRTELIGLLNTETARRNGDFREFESITIGNRLHRAVAVAADDFQTGLVTRFNQAVVDHRMNETAADLPDLTNAYLSPLSITAAQQQAVEAWRTGADALRPIWGVFSRLANVLGYEFGTGQEVSTQLDHAFVLGDVRDWSQAERMAAYFNSRLVGTDSWNKVQPLAPFVYSALSGVPLKLKTLDEAQELRRQIQGV